MAACKRKKLLRLKLKKSDGIKLHFLIQVPVQKKIILWWKQILWSAKKKTYAIKKS